MKKMILLLLLAVLAAFACRREAPVRKAAAPPPPPPEPEITRAVRQARPVIFVGLDGADWEMLDDLMAAGAMPNLAALAREGRTGTLRTLNPPLSPLVWTTMMTGVSPLEHGILDFTRRNPATGALEPIPSSERRAPAVWNMAGLGDKSVAVFGLWATWPAEPVKGLMVADRLSSFTAGDREPPPGIVYPPGQEAWARETLAKADAAVDFDALHAYLPWLSQEDAEKAAADPDPYAHPASALRRILVETRAWHALATSWLAREKPDLAVVYFQGTDTLGHVFAPYAPPRQDAVSAEDFERFSRVPGLYFAEIDRMLGEYRKLAETRGAVLMIASDHGFRWKEGRPARLSSAAAATAGKWHREEGIYLVWGPDVKPDSNRGKGEVGQVCATLLALLGLPPGDGVAGPPVAGIEPVHARLADYRAHYRPAAEVQGDEQADAAEIEKLRALGYLGAKESGGQAGTSPTRTAGSWNNEGLLRLERGETEAAAAAFSQALAVDPQSASAMWNLSDLLHSQRQDLDRSDDLLVKSLAAGLPDGVDYTLARTVSYARSGETERGLKLLDRALKTRPEDPRLHLLRGRYRLERHQCEKALGDFETAARSDPKSALAFASVGLAQLCVGDGEGAARSFKQSLAIDPDQPEIRRALGQIGEAPPPAPVPDGGDGKAREEWFRLRLQEADGKVRADASAHALRSWQTWPARKAASPPGDKVWQEAGPRNIAGRVLSVALDPQNPDGIWAGSAGGGLWRSEDFGQSWRQVGGDHLPSLWIGALAVDPRDPKVLYMGTGEANDNPYGYGGFGGLLKTADGGASFTRIPLPETAFYRTIVSSADSKLVLTAARTGLYRSQDAGGHFVKTLKGKVTDFAQDPGNPARFVAVRVSTDVSSQDAGLFESLDAGQTWHPLGSGIPVARNQWIRGAVAFSPAPSPVMYFALAPSLTSPSPPTLFRSEDGGQTWGAWASNDRKGYKGASFYGAHLEALAGGVLLQANGHDILVSRDGGLDWSLPGGNWHLDTHGIAADPRDPGRIVFATDGGVAVSADGGLTFQRRDAGFPTVQFYACAVGLRDSSSLFGGTQDNWLTVYRGAAGGAFEYSYPPLRGDITAVTVNPAQPAEVVAVTTEAIGVGFSGDEGRSWVSTRGNGIPSGFGFPWMIRLARHPSNPSRVYLGQGRYLDVSADGGRSWSAVTVRPPSDSAPLLAIADLAVSPADGQIWTIWTDGRVLVSQDQGLTWTDLSPLTATGSRAGVRISAGPSAGSAYAVWSGTTGSRLFRTRNGGRTWTDISSGLSEVPVNAILADPRTPGLLMAATDAGVALSTDDGATWQDASGGLPNAVVLDLCLDPASGRLAAATYGRGLWELAAVPPCVPDAATLCLNAGRFEVRAAWAAPDGSSGQAQAAPLTADTGSFTFFDPANVEIVVKVLDACGVNGRFWVYAGGLTNLQTTLTVRDTRTGAVRTYANPQKTAFQPIQDTNAFAGCE